MDCLYEKEHISINSHTIHKLLVASLLIASKFSDDNYYSNKCFADAGMVTLEELNLLEREFLSRLEYHLYVSEKVFNSYCKAISTKYKQNIDFYKKWLCYIESANSSLYNNSFASSQKYWMGDSYWDEISKAHYQSVPQDTDYDLTPDYWYSPFQNSAIDNWSKGDFQ